MYIARGNDFLDLSPIGEHSAAISLFSLHVCLAHRNGILTTVGAIFSTCAVPQPTVGEQLVRVGTFDVQCRFRC